ncbi:MAG: HDOD domain-containing protein [Candidatus Krumholzibacteriota bacterium]|nr:HDOD domain-containing protein [Candidatus Krumholzibacteriota bacterium]
MSEINVEEQATTTKDPREALSRIDRLPSLSNIVGEFLDISKKEMISGRDIQKVLSKDQALVSRLLKLANSSFYGRSGTITSITDAIVMIGLDNVKKIVYAVSSEGLIRRDFKGYPYSEKGFWLHSMGVGTACRVLNERVGEAGFNDEQAFIAGLVHDAGKLIIDDFLKGRTGLGPISLDEERSAAGIDHADLGKRIMERWSIPEIISESVRFHHDPLEGDVVRPDALVVSLADRICNFWNVGIQPFMDLGEEISYADYAGELEILRIAESDLEGILWEIRQKLANLEALYDSNC